MARVTVVCSLILLIGSGTTAQEGGILSRYLERAPGPVELALGSPTVTPVPGSTAPVPVGGTIVPAGEESPEPPLWHSVVGGIAAKAITDGILIQMAGDVFHALPSILYFDPLVTAAGVNIANGSRGSFLVDALASYGSFYLLTTLFYGKFMPAGQFEDPTSYNDFFLSMGVQLFLTVMAERTLAQRPDRLRRR